MSSSFYDLFSQYSWDKVLDTIKSSSAQEVERVLAKRDSQYLIHPTSGVGDGSSLTLEDFGVLLSPAAQEFLEPMAQLSQRLTRKRFGKTMQLYAPLYLSNECTNICTYCGFSLDNKIPRRTLNPDEIMKEVAVLKEMGVDHILLVTGEAKGIVDMPYFKEAIELIRPWFSNISMEVQPLDQEQYKELRREGVHAVMVYQETYHQAEYRKHHPKGKKSIFKYRLETPDRLGRAGIHKIGLGALFGLEDWRADSFFTALHLEYLEREYWQTKYSISFPRLRPHAGGLEPKVEMTDRDLAQLIFAWRIFKDEIDISLSTREAPLFRDHMSNLGVTTMSAGSKTNPGGYAEDKEASLEQFSIDDDRSPHEMSQVLKDLGLESVWKDWDIAYDQTHQEPN
jgi:2-iminoacetate synthase